MLDIFDDDKELEWEREVFWWTDMVMYWSFRDRMKTWSI